MVRILNKYKRQTAGGESGFTLVEQVVSLAILAMVLTAGIAALATGGLSLNVAASKNEAMSLAQAKMECIKDHQFNGGAAYSDCQNVPPEPLPIGYSLSTDIDAVFSACTGDPQASIPNVQRIEVTVYRGSNDVLCLEGLKVDRP